MNFSYTKKGPGRKHNHSGTESRLKKIRDKWIERLERIRINRFSKKFMKNYEERYFFESD